MLFEILLTEVSLPVWAVGTQGLEVSFHFAGWGHDGGDRPAWWCCKIQTDLPSQGWRCLVLPACTSLTPCPAAQEPPDLPTKHTLSLWTEWAEQDPQYSLSSQSPCQRSSTDLEAELTAVLCRSLCNCSSSGGVRILGFLIRLMPVLSFSSCRLSSELWWRF